jgi:hypothetical protein
MERKPKCVFGKDMINKPDLIRKEQKIKIAKKENSTLYLPLNIILTVFKWIKKERYYPILYKFWIWIAITLMTYAIPHPGICLSLF